MTMGSVELSALCLLALACGPAVDGGDTDSEASTSTQEASTDEDSGETTADSGETTADSGESGDVESCDPFPDEGEACPVDGQTCSTDCSDQCQFCNVLSCENGIWSRLEVFPAPCLDCEPLCNLVVPTGCTGGPPDSETCLAGCDEARTSPCAAEFSNTRACAGLEPTFICSDDTRPEVAGCEQQYDALYACMGI